MPYPGKPDLPKKNSSEFTPWCRNGVDENPASVKSWSPSWCTSDPGCCQCGPHRQNLHMENYWPALSPIHGLVVPIPPLVVWCHLCSPHKIYPTYNSHLRCLRQLWLWGLPFIWLVSIPVARVPVSRGNHCKRIAGYCLSPSNLGHEMSKELSPGSLWQPGCGAYQKIRSFQKRWCYASNAKYVLYHTIYP